MADQFTLDMTPAQFAEARTVLSINAAVTDHEESTDQTGGFTAEGIDFTYEFDPQSSKIAVTILRRHGSFFVNHAPVSLVESHFKSLIAAE